MLTIPAGTQTGKQFRLKEKGIKCSWLWIRRLYVDIKVVTPTKLTDRQKELMKEFAQLNGEEINDQPSNFKDRAKDSLRENKV